MASSLNLSVALQAADSARSTAAELGAKVALVIVDPSGTRVLMEKMDGAYLSAEAIASKKAFTAANFRVATDAMAERLGSIDYQNLVSSTDPRLTFLKGGLPLEVEGVMIGAIGVSGGTGDQDLACCRAAADRIEEDLGK